MNAAVIHDARRARRRLDRPSALGVLEQASADEHDSAPDRRTVGGAKCAELERPRDVNARGIHDGGRAVAGRDRD
ncbi:MAG TPA: hypothetical protein VH277_04015, partial [Gemmatimonadaceae bacterium]|nr:hypothetical protein [Gemmatimonadaceae bacterium]